MPPGSRLAQESCRLTPPGAAALGGCIADLRKCRFGGAQACRLRARDPDGCGAGAYPDLTCSEREATRRSPLFSGLPPGSEAQLLRAARVQEFRAGQALFRQDEPAGALFVVLQGWVKLYRMAPSGTEAVVAILQEGQSFGETAVFCGQGWPVSAEAIVPARLLRLDGGHLRRLLQSDAVLARSVLASAFAHLSHLVAHVGELKAQTGVQRAAEFLLALAPEGVGECWVALPYSKALIAGQLGMKPETLSRASARLREHGVQIDATVAHIEDIGRLRGVLADEAS